MYFGEFSKINKYYNVSKICLKTFTFVDIVLNIKTNLSTRAVDDKLNKSDILYYFIILIQSNLYTMPSIRTLK